MNKVSIEFAPLKRYPTISIDGDHISPYSDLASCESKDLHVSAARIIRLLDEEIGNDYQIELQGIPFQTELMRAAAEQSGYCAGVTGRDVPLRFSMEEMAGFAADLADRYSLPAEAGMTVRASGSGLGMLHYPVTEDAADPDLLVERELPEEAPRGKTILLLSDHYEIRNTRSNNIVTVPAGKADDFCQYYELYAKVIPFVEKVFSQCRYKSLRRSDSMLLEAYTDQEAKYVFEINRSEADAGEPVPFLFEVYPVSEADAFTLTTDRPGGAIFRDRTIVASENGPITFLVKDRNGKVLERKTLNVTSHSYVTRIKLMTQTHQLEVGNKGHIDAYVDPENAEDAKSLVWTSSNPDVIHVSSSGDVVALRKGTALITVSSRNCSEQVYLKVSPSLESMSLSVNALRVEHGHSQTVECILNPEDAACGALIWELSNEGMGTLTPSEDGKSCTFTAMTSAFLKGSLRCRVKGSEISASCPLEVVPEKKPTGLITSAMVFSLLGLFGSFLIPLIWFGGGGIGGFFFDICLPIGIILCLIGKSKTNNKEKTFKTMLTLDLIFTGLMFFIAITCCNPPKY